MAGDASPTALRQVEALFRSGSTAALTDGQLLERFADRRDRGRAEASFAAIVDRHGAMVLRVCRQVLGDDHDAQDAAQATFLVLARRAVAISRRESVGGWLHGVARRVASKARVAAARRRAHERRGGAMAAGRTAEGDGPDREHWVELHEELGRLPEAFRAPLVLCYLEGLTQEQAAARLRCPLGTVQSRLARGRDKLKKRLTRRGVAPATALLGPVAIVEAAAPASWAAATVRAALQFTDRGAATAGGAPAAASLAEEVLRAMSFAKWKVVFGILALVATTTGVAVWARQGRKSEPPPGEVAEAKLATLKPTAPVAADKRTVRGIVRDAAGRPIAKAWVGSDPRPMQDTWTTPAPDAIRERKEPFRDERGEVVPPGELGKYFETRDGRGSWHPVHPDDIRPWKGMSFGGDGKAISQAEYDKTNSPYTVRVARGGWWMAGMIGNQNAARTDGEGRFSVEFQTNGMPDKIHFASGDYTQQAIHVAKPEDGDRPIDVTLRPTRLVRFRVLEEPDDDPKAYLRWAAYTTDASGKPVAEWRWWMLPNPNSNDPPHVKRRLETRLPAGRYKFEFRSESINRLVDIDVPAGESTLDLPDVRLPKLATVQMVGMPAAEIDATDLDGKPVKLADYRGKVVVLDFWATWCGPCVGALPRLMEIREKFKDQPLAILALHDGSHASAEAYRKDFAPIREQFLKGKELTFPVLLDRPPAGVSTRPIPSAAGEKGSGRSADTYEIYSWPSTFLIGKDGRLVGKFELDAIEGAIEDALGLPRSNPEKLKLVVDDLESKGPIAVKGKVVGPDGKPVVGATIHPQMVKVRETGDIKTGPDGAFAFTAEEALLEIPFKVEATGLAKKMFLINLRSEAGSLGDAWARSMLRLGPGGELPGPLKLGKGVAVTGRVVRDGRPEPGAPMGLSQVNRTMDTYLGDPETTTDADGRFRFANVPAPEDYFAYAKTGGLKDRGAMVPRPFKAGGDGAAIDLGDFPVRPGLTLAGRVVFADGKKIPPKTNVLASRENASGLIYAKVDEAGRFEVKGLPEGQVSISVQFPDIRTWLPAGYRLSAKNKCLDPLNNYHIEGQLTRDISDLTILFEPGDPPPSTLDPGPLADFKEAKAGPIAGAPPGTK